MNLRNLLLTFGLIAAIALPAAAQAPPADLSMDNVTKVYMVLADVDAKGKSDAAFKTKLDSMAPSDWGADADTGPMLSKAGIDGSEFASVFMTYMKAASAAGLIKGGADRAATITQMQTTDASVDFVITNNADLKALDGKYPNAMVQAP